MRPIRANCLRVALLVVTSLAAIPAIGDAAMLWGRPLRVSGPGAANPAVAAAAAGDAVIAWSRPDLLRGHNRIEAVIHFRRGWGATRQVGSANLLIGQAPAVGMDGHGMPS